MKAFDLHANTYVERPSWLQFRRYRFHMGGVMLAADLIGFLLAASFVFILNEFFNLFLFQLNDLWYGVLVVFTLIFFSHTKLYPSIGLNPAEEIRLVVTETFLGFLTGSFIIALNQRFWHPNLLALIPFAFLSMAFVLASRWSLRILSVRMGTWGAPMVVVGLGHDVNRVVRFLNERRRLGFRPLLLFTDQPGDKDITQPVDRLNMNVLLSYPQDYFAARNIFTVLVVNPSHAGLDPEIARRLAVLFPRQILISDMPGLEGASMQIHDMEGIIGLETTSRILGPLDVIIKRGMDIVFALMLGLLSSPLWLLTMLAIKLDSPGPILFKQPRVGMERRKTNDRERRDGHVHTIEVLKFRTMVLDAEKKLEEYLMANPAARAEWEQTQKLKDDPRITRVGKWIRKFSVDEIPQFLNVLRGDMSMVGPRPMMLDQIRQYGRDIDIYTSVRPGITGFWQVSGRNKTSFQERVAFDRYYVHNWSPWLDIYILLRTVWVVLSRDGAY